MWCRDKMLARPIKAKNGRQWHFCVWMDFVKGDLTQRVFFWDEARRITGCAEFAGEEALHWHKLKRRIHRIANEPSFRARFRRELRFPVERHYR